MTDLPARHAAMVEAASRFTAHWLICPSRKTGLDCLKCYELETIALDAADRYEAARRREAVPVS